MAIVVLHRESKRKYILIGTGYGAYKASRPSVLGGSLFPHEDMGEIPVAAVSDSNGKIHWFLTEDLQVIEIDGQSLGNIINENEIVNKTKQEIIETDYCPACNFKVLTNERECPSCGLTLIIDEG